MSVQQQNVYDLIAGGESYVVVTCALSKSNIVEPQMACTPPLKSREDCEKFVKAWESSHNRENCYCVGIFKLNEIKITLK